MNGCKEPAASTGCARRATRSDLAVDVLDAFVAKRKRAAKPTFEGGRWIKNEAAAWLHCRRQIA